MFDIIENNYTSGGAVLAMMQDNISTVLPRPISSAKIPPLNDDPSLLTTTKKPNYK